MTELNDRGNLRTRELGNTWFFFPLLLWKISRGKEKKMICIVWLSKCKFSLLALLYYVNGSHLFRVSIEFLKYVSNWAALAFLQVVFSIILFPQLMIAWTLLSVTHASRMISICAWMNLKSKIAHPLPLTAVSRLLEDTSLPTALQLSLLVLPEVAFPAQVR